MQNVKSVVMMLLTMVLKKHGKVVEERKKLLSMWMQDEHPAFSPAQLTADSRESLKPL